MVSFIIIAKEKKKRVAYVKEFAEKYKINAFDITTIEKDTGKNASQSIGIEVVKLIQKKIFFKPLKSANKIILIDDAQLLTPEAQNALLKVLEEPPANTYIMLGTETKEALLPTILSRCQSIELEEEQNHLSTKAVEELQAFIQELPTLSIGNKLKEAEKLAKDKDKAISWIGKVITVLREELLNAYIQPQDSKTLDTFTMLTMIKKLQALNTLLKTTNVNPRFAIEHTLLSL